MNRGQSVFAGITALLWLGCGSSGNAPGGHDGGAGAAGAGVAGAGVAGAGVAGASGTPGGAAGMTAGGAGADAAITPVDAAASADSGAATGDGGGTTLSVTADDSHAVSMDMALTGGTIAATGADGTRYELVIPPNALDEPTTITLTPAATSGTIFGEMRTSALGVQFAPQGLFLWQRATLTVTPAAGADIPLDEQLFVHWEDGGKDLGVATVDPTSQEMKVFVDHFSGLSIFDVKGIDSMLSAGEQWIADTQDEQFRSQVAEAVALQKRGSSSYQTMRDQLVGDLGQEYIDQVLDPRIKEAGTSCAHAKLAMTSALEFARDLGMLGDADKAMEWNKKAFDVFPARAQVCMKEEYEICRDDHILERILTVRWTIDTQRILCGLTPFDINAEKLDEYVRGCLAFKVVLDGFAGFKVDKGYTMEHKVSADAVDVQLGGDFESWIATKPWMIGPAIPLTTVSYTPTDPDPCHQITDVSPQDSTFMVTSFDISIIPKMKVQDFTVKYAVTPNHSSFDDLVYAHMGSGCSTDPPATIPGKDINWYLCHLIITAQKNPGDPTDHTFTLKNWDTTVLDDDVGTYVFAYSLPQNGGLVYNHDTFTVRHAPVPVADPPPATSP
jgi:hypothetical protein